MEIAHLLQTPSSLTLFIAPPAWGKTSLLLDMPGPWIFVAPLRALAEEFAERIKAEGRKVKILRRRNQKEWQSFAKNPQGILVATPETLPSHLPQIIVEKCVLVLDEFHLFQKWGEDFRPLLREQLYAWANLGARILGLSATVDKEQIGEVKRWRQHGFEQIIIIDIGNMRFKNPPKRILNYGKNRTALKRRVYWESRKNHNSGIIFCKSRWQVKLWQEWFELRRIPSLACVGGQVEQFRKNLAKQEKTAWIVTTSALSHGVNLPSFNHVFIDHKPDSHSMWLQMAARGGRKGEAFYLHAMEMEDNSVKQKLKIWTFDVLVRTQLYLSA